MADDRLIDRFGRRIEYLRVSLTQRCNYRCFYCMPGDGRARDGQGALLTDDELVRLVANFSQLGVHKVRLTGGEPLLRRNLPDLIARLHGEAEIHELSLSTNGHLLAAQAHELAGAGLHRVNISLDSLNPVTFARITRTSALHRVLRGVSVAQDAGLSPIKINMVVIKGVNDGEIEEMLDFALDMGLELRFIETMPIGSAGIDGMRHFYPQEDILRRLRAYGDGAMIQAAARGSGPARYYRFRDSGAKVGIISATSQHFCATCNRVRLTADGDLALCLGNEGRLSLRKVIRGGRSDRELKRIIRNAIDLKPERHHFNERPEETVLVRMNVLGG